MPLRYRQSAEAELVLVSLPSQLAPSLDPMWRATEQPEPDAGGAALLHTWPVTPFDTGERWPLYRHLYDGSMFSRWHWLQWNFAHFATRATRPPSPWTH